MLLTKLKSVMVLFVVAALCSATGLICRTQAAEQARAQQADKDQQPAAPKNDAKPEPDAERLQGTWKIICDDDSSFGNCIDGKWTIKGATIRVEVRMKDEDTPGIRELKWYYRFRLDEKTNPKRIVLIQGEADDLFDLAKSDQKLDHPAETDHGIYCLAGDTLKICLRASKWNEKPTRFDSEQGVLIILKRATPKGGTSKNHAEGKFVHPPEYRPPAAIDKP